MTELDVFHKDESEMSFALSEFEAVVRLRVRKGLNLKKVYVHFGNKYQFSKFEKQEMSLQYDDGVYEYYESYLKLNDRRLSYYFTFKHENQTYVYTQEGIEDHFDPNLWQYSLFQIGFINTNDIHRLVSWTKNAVFYQIFVDRFHKGNKEKDTSYITMSFDDKSTPANFYGGDLQGIIEKIPYLKKLGVNAIYLTPIFESTSNHKYNIADYYSIDKMFGDMETFKELVNKLHENNMKVVLDAVFNHCATNHPFFLDAKEKGKESKYFNYFMVNGDTIDFGDQTFNYASFGKHKYMPKLDTSNLEVRKYLIDIATYYIKELDIDGWRLDVADEISHDFWRHFREEVKACKQDALILGEVWPDSHSFLRGDQFDSVMNYPFRRALLKFFKGDLSNVRKLSDDLNRCLVSNTLTVNKMMYNLLDSHDSARFYTEISCDDVKQKLAYLIQFFYLGMPALYYGDEYHLEGENDPDCRRAMKFDKFSSSEKEMFSFVSKLIKLRKTNKIFANGSISIREENNKFKLVRSLKNDSLTLLINFSDKKTKVTNKEILLTNAKKESVLDHLEFIVYKN